MGFPPRLDGKYTLLPSDETETCPNCHRKFSTYVVKKDNTAKRECPYCDHEFEVKKEKPIKKKGEL
jgi:transcription elongation factor Elf1